ncbi:MAG: ABC transporter permease subunit [Coriobacteriia bacterium]|nr:ABC transporter permease subunit [Coriobacteriia bacterium]
MRKSSSQFFARALIMINIIFVVVLPLALIVVWAFSASWPWPHLLPQQFSSRGLEELFSNRVFGGVLLQSILIALGTSFSATTIATMAAHSLLFYPSKLNKLIRFLLILPFLVATPIFAMGIQVFFLKIKLANTVLGVIVAHTILALPYAAYLMMDAYSALGRKFFEQSQTLGAHRLQSFYLVDLPLLLPSISSALLMSYIISFSQYFITLLIGGGTVQTISLLMFPYLVSGDRTLASSYGLVFMLATIAFMLILQVISRKASKTAALFDS